MSPQTTEQRLERYCQNRDDIDLCPDSSCRGPHYYLTEDVDAEITRLTQRVKWLEDWKDACEDTISRLNRKALERGDVPRKFRQIGIKHKTERSEYLWWDTPNEGSAIFALDWAAMDQDSAPDVRAPLPPDVLVDASPDRVRTEPGPARAGRSVRAEMPAPRVVAHGLLTRCDGTNCKGHPFNCYGHPNDCGCQDPR